MVMVKVMPVSVNPESQGLLSMINPQHAFGMSPHLKTTPPTKPDPILCQHSLSPAHLQTAIHIATKKLAFTTLWKKETNTHFPGIFFQHLFL